MKVRGHIFVAATLCLAAVASFAGTGATAGATSHTANTTATLTVAIPGDISDLNPYTDELIQYEYALGHTVFQSLVRFTKALKVVPDAANSYTVNPGATVFTFHLNPGLKFQDGSPLNATAVVAALKDAAAANGPWSLPLQNVAQFSAPKPTTVVLKLAKPNAALINTLAQVPLVSPNSYSKATGDPIGSGPFKFVSWTPNAQIELERWTGYAGTKPSYKYLVFKPITTPEVAANDLYAGEVDIVVTVTSSVARSVNKSQASVVQPATSNTLITLMFNSKKVPLVVRRALSYALDKKAIQKIAYGGNGKITNTPMTTTTFAYAHVPGQSFDLAKAKALLAKSGHAHITVTLAIPTGFPAATQLGKVWQSDLAQIGVTLKLNVQPLTAWLAIYNAQTYDICWNTVAVSGDPSSFFNLIYDTQIEKNFSDPTAVKLAAAAIATSKQSARRSDYVKLQSILNTEVPILFDQWVPLYGLVSNNVKGYAMNPIGWGLFTTVTVK